MKLFSWVVNDTGCHIFQNDNKRIIAKIFFVPAIYNFPDLFCWDVQPNEFEFANGRELTLEKAKLEVECWLSRHETQ
jgi:hypothetical protein